MKEVLLDSSVLVDYFTGSLAPEVEKFLESSLVSVSILSYFEVCKYFYKIGRTKELEFTMQKLASLKTFYVNREVCEYAAKLSHATNLAMADSLIYATAAINRLDLVTGDSHFKGMDGVVFVKK